MLVTKKSVILAVKNATGFTPEFYKEEGSYHWGGKIACLFSGCNIHISTLNNPNFKLEDFVKDFKSKILEVEADHGDSMLNIVAGIDWEITYV